MPRTCTVCTHTQRAEIDTALVAGESARKLAAIYRVSDDAITRHKAHLTQVLLKAHEVKEVSRADDLLNRLSELTTEARRIKDKAESAGDFRTAISGIRELVRIVELIAKLQGELDDRPQVNVLVTSSEWLALRTRLMLSLEPYPEARRAVVTVLREHA